MAMSGVLLDWHDKIFLLRLMSLEIPLILVAKMRFMNFENLLCRLLRRFIFSPVLNATTTGTMTI